MCALLVVKFAGASLSSWLNQTITANGTNCTTALVALTSCSNDNSGNSSSNSSTPGLTSLQIQQGCCSSACAKAVEEVGRDGVRRAVHPGRMYLSALSG